MSVYYGKTKTELIAEVMELRQRLAEMESSGPPPGTDNIPALADSELLRSLMTNSDDYFMLLDSDLRIVFINNTAPGLTQENVIGTPIHIYAPEKDQLRVKKLLVEALGNGTPARYETEYVEVDGETTIFESIATPLSQISDGICMTVMSRDITKSKHVELELRKQRSFLERAQEIGSIGTWELDIGKNELLWTDENYRIFGVPLGVGMTYELFLDCVHPDDRDYVDTEWTAAVHGKPYDIEHRLIVNDKVKWVREKADLVFDEAGACLSATGVTQDISAHKSAEAERLTLESQIQHSQKLESLGVLAGGIAHDFNNLLMAMLGNADLALLDLPPQSPVQSSLLAIQSAGRRASELTNQMLAYSGRGKFETHSVDLSTLVGEISELMGSSIGKKTRLVSQLESGLTSIIADSAQLQQVIMNLITNASEAIGDDRSGTITISTSTQRCDQGFLDTSSGDIKAKDGTFACIRVEDNGCGMDDDTKLKMFDPFYTTKFTGRGLGLSATLGIVRGHGGAIIVDSQPGKGTVVQVLIPTVEGSSPESNPGDALPDHDRCRGSGMVLVVDDEEAVRRVAVRMVEQLGFEVLQAEDGQEAVEVFHRNAESISCVLLDLTMPRMDGLEAYLAISNIREDVPVILSSGYTETEILDRFQAAAVAGFIQKPYELDKLSATIQSVLSKA